MWEFEEYTKWSRQLACSYDKDELNKMLAKRLGSNANGQFKATSSRSGGMHPPTMRHAMSGNVNRSDYLHLTAIKNALELHDLYPEKCKNGR